jgi:hypothetical protein
MNKPVAGCIKLKRNKFLKVFQANPKALMDSIPVEGNSTASMIVYIFEYKSPPSYE